MAYTRCEIKKKHIFLCVTSKILFNPVKKKKADDIRQSLSDGERAGFCKFAVFPTSFEYVNSSI